MIYVFLLYDINYVEAFYRHKQHKYIPDGNSVTFYYCRMNHKYFMDFDNDVWNEALRLNNALGRKMPYCVTLKDVEETGRRFSFAFKENTVICVEIRDVKE